MLVSLIAAMDEQRIIGADNRLPWRMPADMRRFREITMGKAVIMGRRTFESIGKALPGRFNVVVSRDPAFEAAGCIVAENPGQALAVCRDQEEAVIIGGAQLYREIMPHVGRMYLTFIHARFAGDTRFPPYAGEEWREVERRDFEADDRNPYAFSFVVLERV